MDKLIWPQDTRQTGCGGNKDKEGWKSEASRSASRWMGAPGMKRLGREEMKRDRYEQSEE